MEVGSKLDKFLGSGAEGTVYYVDGYAVKIFHKLDLNKLYKISTMMEMEHYNLVLSIWKLLNLVSM